MQKSAETVQPCPTLASLQYYKGNVERKNNQPTKLTMKYTQTINNHSLNPAEPSKYQILVVIQTNQQINDTNVI